MDFNVINNTFNDLFEADLKVYLSYASVVFWVSLVCFFVTLCAALAAIYYLPHDHFLPRANTSTLDRKKQWLFKLLLAPLKNILGLCLLCIGLVLLILPGQGLVTILMAILLIDLPGKDILKNQLIANSQVRRSLNWLRSILGKPPFAFQKDVR
jgi:hypothetical protein